MKQMSQISETFWLIFQLVKWAELTTFKLVSWAELARELKMASWAERAGSAHPSSSQK